MNIRILQISSSGTKHARIAPQIAQSMQQRWALWAGGILLLALLVRSWGLGAESMWIDEAYSIMLAKYKPPEIIVGTAADQHPPLYYLMLHIWLKFGDGVRYARWLSVLVGVTGVLQAMLFGKRTGGYALGLLGGLLVAFNPMHIWYSQEVRMYIFTASLTLAATHILWNGLHAPDQRRWWLGYALFATLALYTHYFSAFVLAAQGGWVIYRAIREKLFSSLGKWLLAISVTGILFLPWAPVALYQSQAHALKWLQAPTLAQIRDTFLSVLLGAAIHKFPPWLRTSALLFVIASVAVAFARMPQAKRYPTAYLGCMTALPFAAVALISIAYPIFQYKQFVIIVIPLLLWLALSSRNLPHGWGAALVLGVLAFSTATAIYQSVSLTKDNWRGASAYIQTHIQPDDVILGNPAAVSLALAVYSDGLLPQFYGYPPDYSILRGGWAGETITAESADTLLRTVTQGQQHVWLLEFFPDFWDTNREIEIWLSENARLVDELWFNRIHIRLYELGG